MLATSPALIFASKCLAARRRVACSSSLYSVGSKSCSAIALVQLIWSETGKTSLGVEALPETLDSHVYLYLLHTHPKFPKHIYKQQPRPNPPKPLAIECLSRLMTGLQICLGVCSCCVALVFSNESCIPSCVVQPC